MKDDLMNKFQYLMMFGGLGVGFIDILLGIINPVLQCIGLLVTLFLGGLKLYDRFKSK